MMNWKGLDRMWLCHIRDYVPAFTRWAEENSDITLAGRRCHGRDLNPAPLEYKFRVYHFASLFCRYVFSSPAILNSLLVHVSLRLRYQTSRPDLSLIRRCVLDSRRSSALKYSIFHSTTNELA